MVQMLVLTGQRRDEVAGMSRRELKQAVALWTLPAERAKNRRTHDVPLSAAAQNIVGSMPRIGQSEYLFTTTGKAPISGYSNAKERLDAVVLALARDEGLSVEPWRLHDLRR